MVTRMPRNSSLGGGEALEVGDALLEDGAFLAFDVLHHTLDGRGDEEVLFDLCLIISAALGA